MYQLHAVQAVRSLARHLRLGGAVVFQKHDTTMTPASLAPVPLHARAQAWLHSMIERERADPHIGFHLHGILTRAGLVVETVRAEAFVQTPDVACAFSEIIRACLGRITDSLFEHSSATRPISLAR